MDDRDPAAAQAVGAAAPARPDGRGFDDFAEAVLDVVRAVPAGRVLTYGDVAEYLADHPSEDGGTGPTGALDGARTGSTAGPLDRPRDRPLAGHRPRYGPRAVARVLSTRGGAVPWWRVVRADGSLPGHLATRALARYEQEGTPLRPGRDTVADLRVDVTAARWHG